MVKGTADVDTRYLGIWKKIDAELLAICPVETSSYLILETYRLIDPGMMGSTGRCCEFRLRQVPFEQDSAETRPTPRPFQAKQGHPVLRSLRSRVCTG